jgi:hypothetical protein
MVDDSRVEKVPDKAIRGQIVWLSPNCCELMPASQPPRIVQPAAQKAIDPVPPLRRFQRLLQRIPRMRRPR